MRRVDERDRRRRRPAALPAGASREQLGEVLLVGGVLAGEARRAHAGRAAERRGLDARVVGDRRARRSPRAAARALASAFSANVSPVSGGSSTSSGQRARPRAAPAAPRTRAPCARCGSRGRASRRPRGGDRAAPARRAAPRCPRAASASSSSRCARDERRALGGRLDLDEPAVAGHDDVGVDLGGGVLGVVEVEQRRRRRRCPHEIAATVPVSGERSSSPLGDERAQASASAT